MHKLPLHQVLPNQILLKRKMKLGKQTAVTKAGQHSLVLSWLLLYPQLQQGLN